MRILHYYYIYMFKLISKVCPTNVLLLAVKETTFLLTVM